MNGRRTVVVAGASGVVGLAALRAFANAGWRAIGVSRRRPVDVEGFEHVALDLSDAYACAGVLGSLQASHLVYAALRERPGLVAGWTDSELMRENLAMFDHFVDPLITQGGVEHVSLLQGTKAYGVHLGPAPIPCKEHAPRSEHENFYFLQEDSLTNRAARHGFTTTILRPQVVYGESLGSPMNVIPVIGAYGALLRERGLPLSYPGGPRAVLEAVDADLVGQALVWAADAPAARGEVFNIANGDVFTWHDVWPAIADALGMKVGEPQPVRLAEELPRRADEWAAIVARWRLRAPTALEDFVGDSPTYADMLLRPFGTPPPLPTLTSTIKLRHAGFGECTDTETMFSRLIAKLQDRRLLPPR